MKMILEWLRQCKTCIEGYRFSAQFDCPVEWWDSIERGDWCGWVIDKLLDRNDEQQLRKFILCKAEIAETVLHLMQDERSKKAVEIAKLYGQGKATKEELAAAADAAYAADADAAADAAYVAACTAAACTGIARTQNQKQTAEIIRRHYPAEKVIKMIIKGNKS